MKKYGSERRALIQKRLERGALETPGRPHLWVHCKPIHGLLDIGESMAHITALFNVSVYAVR